MYETYTKLGYCPSYITENANEIYHIDSIVDLVKRAQAGEKVFPDNINIVTGGFPMGEARRTNYLRIVEI